MLDNHQIELAEVLAKQGYLVHGRLEYESTPLSIYRMHDAYELIIGSNLPAAVQQVASLRQRQREEQESTASKVRSMQRSSTFMDIVDDEVGWLD